MKRAFVYLDLIIAIIGELIIKMPHIPKKTITLINIPVTSKQDCELKTTTENT